MEQNQNDTHHRFYGFDEWLNALSSFRPDKALFALERFLVHIKLTKLYLYDFDEYSQLLTRLFREAEENEEADNGAMLNRVIAVQDSFLAIGVSGLDEWLRDAERHEKLSLGVSPRQRQNRYFRSR